MSERRTLPDRREHVTQKVKVGGQRTLYISVHEDPQPAELFVRVKGAGCTAEVIALYDVLARPELPGAPIRGPAREGGRHAAPDPVRALRARDRPFAGQILHESARPDRRHMLIEYCGREDLAHASDTAMTLETETLPPGHDHCVFEGASDVPVWGE